MAKLLGSLCQLAWAYRIWGLKDFSPLWSLEGLLFYFLGSLTLSSQVFFEPAFKWYVEGEGLRAFHTLDIYIWSLINVFVFGVSLVFGVFKGVFGAFNREEIGAFRKKLITFLPDLASIAHAGFNSCQRCGYGTDHVYFFATVTFIYMVLAAAHWLAMIKCDSMVTNMDSSQNFNTLKRLVNNWIFTLLIIDLYFTYAALSWLWNFQDLIFLGFLFRFIGLVLETVHTRVWYGIRLKKWQATRKAGYDPEKFDQEFMDAKATKSAIQFTPAMLTLFSHESISSWSFSLSLACSSIMSALTTSPGSLVSDMLILQEVKESEVTESNSMCVICNQVMVYSGKSVSFEETDAVKAQCGHMFHYACILNQLDDNEKSNKCPTCQVGFYHEKTVGPEDATKESETKETKKSKKSKKVKKVANAAEDDTSTDSVISNASFLAPGSQSEENGRL